MTKWMPFPAMIYASVAILALTGLFLIAAIRLNQLGEENAALQERIEDMTRNANQFHDDLEACQREKGVEWRERMQAVCAGYAMGGQP
jgi:FtsZ-binding cell division protein ZapB